MGFKLPRYNHPNFSEEIFVSAPDAEYKLVEKDKVQLSCNDYISRILQNKRRMDIS